MQDPREGVFLRVYDPIVKYLENPFFDTEGVYFPGEEVVFTIVRQSPSSWGAQEWPETSWVFPEEIRLLASIALSLPEGIGTLSFAPCGYQLQLDSRIEDLSDLEFIHISKAIAINHAHEIYGDGICYQLRRANTSGEDFQRILYNGTDVGDSLMIRGLSCLLKSQHLIHVESNVFCEDAFINVQIAREGALQIIRRLLREKSGKPASYEDAYEYISQNFQAGNFLASYLKEQYDKWIMAKHPESRWGIFWSPPLLADDFFETYEALVSIYRHLISGEPGRVSAQF